MCTIISLKHLTNIIIVRIFVLSIRRNAVKTNDMKIINKNSGAVSASTVSAIEKQCKDIDFRGDVSLVHTNDNTDHDPTYDVYDLQADYLFSIDTDGDVIYDR